MFNAEATGRPHAGHILYSHSIVLGGLEDTS